MQLDAIFLQTYGGISHADSEMIRCLKIRRYDMTKIMCKQCDRNTEPGILYTAVKSFFLSSS
jgi:hypothetical protein